MQSQLSLFEQTVLEAVSIKGSTKSCYGHVSASLGLTSADMKEKVFRGSKAGFVGKWQHKIRSVQQTLKNKGLIDNSTKRGFWKLTNKGRKKLNFAKPNSLNLYFTTKKGMAFWGDSNLLSELFTNEVNLIITSPFKIMFKRNSKFI